MMENIANLRTYLTKIKPIILWLMVAYPAYKLILNGLRKFDDDGMWTNAFENWGYPVWFRIFIGVLETFGGLLIFIPKLRHIGALVLFVVMLGALVTRVIHGTNLDDALYISFFALIFLYLISYSDEK